MNDDEGQRTTRYRICVVNGVFVSGGLGEDGRVLPPQVFARLAEHLAETTGMRAWALWPYCDRRIFNVNDFARLTRRGLIRYSEYLARCIREDLACDPLQADETLAFVVYSGGAPIVQVAAKLLLPEIRTGAYVFFGPALRPHMTPRNWAEGARVGIVLGAHDWVQGVYPRIPRPWHREASPGTLARLRAHLPAHTRYHTLPCNHWPGYFLQETWPALIGAISDLLVPGYITAHHDQAA